MDLQKACDFAERIARLAGDEILMRHHGTLAGFTWDQRTHIKTLADEESDCYLRREIGAAFPEHNILSEESDAREVGSAMTWVVDPLDGTVVFTSESSDYFAVCVALCDGRTPAAGVIYAPERHELYRAVRGRGAMKNGQPIAATAPLLDVRQARVALEYGKPPGRTQAVGIIDKLLAGEGVTAIFTSNCASVSLALTTSGVYHAFVAPFLQPWDMAAAAVICREAGARVTDRFGKEWELGDESIFVAHSGLHDQLMAKLR
ncbi:MAG: inositol monophosphatase [Candidatus Sungbacteria bacterium]|uniref:Inositol monophosphatase n=1 Tax=Candidatus Sungiibacteriota bacterium TaxID=2750080 RepID=A0A932YVS2_9BACT|nr:inositol monophosphatase [Candidatus Sungbacteria bacterium]